jgi:hypothetical protein
MIKKSESTVYLKDFLIPLFTAGFLDGGRLAAGWAKCQCKFTGGFKKYIWLQNL